MLDRSKSAVASVCIALLLGGCVGSLQNSDGSAGVAVAGGGVNYHVGGAAGCGGPIAEFQTVMDNDQRTGNVNQTVYRRVMTDLDGVKAACAAARVGEANSRLAAIKARYGYR